MTCRRSLEIELSDFLAAPRAPAFDSFRQHYPRCAECSAEVRAWTQLHARLSPEHPDPERLARYARLAPGDRAEVDGHLAGCPSCREELRQLEAFAPERLASDTPRQAGWRAGLAGLGRLAWSPAFAYALLVLALAPGVYRGLRGAPDLVEGARLEKRAVAPASRDLAAGAASEPSPVPAAEAPVEERARVPRAADEIEAPAAFAARQQPPLVARAERPAPALSAGGREPASVVRLRVGEHREMAAPGGEWTELRLALPPGIAGAEVRLVEAGGARELRQRVAAEPADARADAPGTAMLRVPSAWLEPGLYSLELRRSGAPASEPPAAVAELEVRPR
jgi:hypothetical protein